MAYLFYCCNSIPVLGKLVLVYVNGIARRKPKADLLENANPIRNDETGLWQCPFCLKRDFPELSDVSIAYITLKVLESMLSFKTHFLKICLLGNSIHFFTLSEKNHFYKKIFSKFKLLFEFILYCPFVEYCISYLRFGVILMMQVVLVRPWVFGLGLITVYLVSFLQR